MSKCIFGDASLDDILFNVNTLGSSLHIPDDANELTVAISSDSNCF